jgi:hypothetical protein
MKAKGWTIRLLPKNSHYLFILLKTPEISHGWRPRLAAGRRQLLKPAIPLCPWQSKTLARVGIGT